MTRENTLEKRKFDLIFLHFFSFVSSFFLKKKEKKNEISLVDQKSLKVREWKGQENFDTKKRQENKNMINEKFYYS